MRVLGWLLLLAAGSLSAAGTGSVSTDLRQAHLGPLTGWTAADLDGDLHPDFAHAGKFHAEGLHFVQQISFSFSGAPPRTIAVRTSSVAARIVVRDIDGDRDHDLILETFTREPVAVLLNDGDGTFHQGDLEAYRSRLAADQYSFESPFSPAPVFLFSNAPGHHALPTPSFIETGMAFSRAPALYTSDSTLATAAPALSRGPPASIQ